MIFVSKKKYEVLQKNYDDLQKIVDEKIKNKKALKAVNEKLELDIQILNADLLKAQEENRELKETNEQLNKEVNDNVIRISELSTKLLNEKQSKGAYKGRCTTLEKTCITLEKENKKVNEDLISARSIIVALEDKIKKLKNKPTLAELKTEKMNKVDMKKIVGSRKRGK